MATIKLRGGSVKEIIQDSTYKDGGFKALSDTKANVSSAVIITDDINPAVPGDYTVTYTLPVNVSGDKFEVQVEVVETRTITVVAPEGTIDTTFDLGDESRTGVDTSGTTYDQVVDAASAGTEVSPTQAALFDEGALDPYEVKHSK